jgi:hypothetical protein
MATADESENLLDHLSERIIPRGWRVISNPTRRPDPQADELKTLIQTMEARRTSDKRKPDETDPLEEAA